MDTDIYVNPKTYNKVGNPTLPHPRGRVCCYFIAILKKVSKYFTEFGLSSQVHEIEGIKIITYCSPLYFANSEIFRQKVIAKVRHHLLEPRGAGQRTTGSRKTGGW